MKYLMYVIRFIRNLFVWILLLPVFFYKCCISPILPSMCRFQPTCSTFMVESLKQKGPIWGLLLGIYRLLRCNPFNPGGYDPVERWPPYWTGKKWVWKIPKNIEEKLVEEEVKLAEKLLEQHRKKHEKPDTNSSEDN